MVQMLKGETNSVAMYSSLVSWWFYSSVRVFLGEELMGKRVYETTLESSGVFKLN